MFVIWGGFGQNGVHFGSDTRKRVEKEKGKRKKKRWEGGVGSVWGRKWAECECL